MLVWFTMLGGLGLIQMFDNLSIISALNPYYAYKLLSVHGGYLYLAKPPLYKISFGKAESYAYTEEEKDQVMAKNPGKNV